VRIILLALVIICNGFCEEFDKARYLLDEQLSMEENKGLKTHIRILEKTNKFILVDNVEKNMLPEINKEYKEKG
jgi:hypothetical protein